MRDCENCKHHSEKGCSQWECSFEPKNEQYNKEYVDAIDKFLATKMEMLVWLIKRQAEGYGTSNGELLDHIYDKAEQLKEQKNENSYRI